MSDLERDGWVRRFVAAPARLPEVVELYRSLGLEVRLEPVEAEDLPEACGECRAAMALFRVVYTR
ncbi:MAG: hypothetical protein AB1758_18870 [Candidatus Eremiobacterota bacterium]